MRSIRDSGVTVVLIEHNMGLVMSLCERVIVLDSGERDRRGPARPQVASHPAVLEAYLGKSALPAATPQGTEAPDDRARQTAPGAALAVSDLAVRYGGVSAVRSVSFTVEPGQSVGLIGANGAGKTSTLRALMGLVPRAARRGPVRRPRPGQGARPRHGAARHRVRARGPARLRRAERGEEPAARRLRAPLGRRTRATLDEVYELFPVLGEMRARLAGALSGGQQQMLAIGRALMARPVLLLLDEPSMGLSPKLVEVIGETLRRLRGDGLSLLLVEQNAMLTFETTTDCLVLENGEVALSGTSAELRGNPRVRSVYLGL